MPEGARGGLGAVPRWSCPCACRVMLAWPRWAAAGDRQQQTRGGKEPLRRLRLCFVAEYQGL